MRKIILSIVILTSLAAQKTECQTVIEKPHLDKEYYLNKSKQQKKTGWILLGSGALITTATIAIALDNISIDLSDQGSSGSDAGFIPLIAGCACMAGGAIELIAGSINKRKAKSLGAEIKNERLLLYDAGLSQKPSYLAAGIRIPIR